MAGKSLLARFRELTGTVRVRTTAVAVIVVGATLFVAAVAMVVVLRRSLTDDVRRAALVRAESVALEGIDGPLPVANLEEEFVQVVDADGEVLASSRNLVTGSAVTQIAPGETKRIEGLEFEDDPFLVVAVTPSGGDATVISGRSLETVTESTEAVVSLLVIGIPALLIVLGAIVWRVVGRSLAPVESIRAEVDGISNAELHRRVTSPRGRDEIARLAATMNRMLERLEVGNQRLRRFVSDASHELRSPVSTIRQHAEVARSHPEQTSVEQLAGIVLHEEARLEGLVDDLLFLARIDEGTFGLHLEPVDLDDLVFAAAGRLRNSTGLSIDSGHVSAGRIAGDRKALDRLVRNLIDNAARHARREIALALRNGSGEIILTVDDDGDGVPVADRDRVFERFVRLAEARDRDSGGSGIGLAIVAEIAGAHGGGVRVLDSPLGGARFEVRLPSIEGP
jgi:signal transduction histidine kinase